MSDETARLPPVSKSLRDQFKADVEERHGTVRGHYRSEVEKALREYLNASQGGDTHDRLRRLEDQVDAIASEVGVHPDAESGKKKKDSGVSATTLNRLDAIEAQIQREADGASKVHESVINAAIEDHAGTSEPTLRRYKQMLKQRQRAFENPHEKSDTWFVDEDDFVTVVENNFPHRNDEIASQYGGEWYDRVLDRITDDDDDDRRSAFA